MRSSILPFLALLFFAGCGDPATSRFSPDSEATIRTADRSPAVVFLGSEMASVEDGTMVRIIEEFPGGNRHDSDARVMVLEGESQGRPIKINRDKLRPVD